jgi:YD repeat-containing protein
MYLTYDQQADAVYVYFSQRPVVRTEALGDAVAVDYDAAGTPVGVEFLNVSSGIDLAHVPRRSEVAKLLEERHFKVYA